MIEDALIPSKGGRPAQLFRYNLDFKQVLVIYSYVKNGLYKGFRHMAGEVGHLPIGIDWTSLNHYYEEEFLEAAVRLCSTLIAILNLEQVVLYGEFITINQLLKIEQRCKSALLPSAHPTFYLSESFQLDYDTGITISTLSLLDENLAGFSQK